MHPNLLRLVLGLALYRITSALPKVDEQLHNDLTKRAFTTDNTCGLIGAGLNNGLTCDPSLAQGGPCCSQNGFCGTTVDYCGTGCQPGYGTCTTGAGGGTVPTTPGTGACGPSNGNAKCPAGQCCSAAGFCGNGPNYCTDPDCQYLYGTCDSNTVPAGPSTANDPRPLNGPVSYTTDINDCISPNVVALTYDDGPYFYTAQLLDILKAYGFHATFFITGNNLGKGPIDTTAPYPSLVQRMIAEGHQVASHTWSHYSLDTIGSAKRIEQMTYNERALANIIGKYPTYMRPPYSQCSAASGCQADMQKLGYHRIYFDLDTQDYLHTLPTNVQVSKDIVRTTLAGAVAGGDFLSIQHDIHQQSVANLTSYYFDLIKAKGWTGVTAGECLQDPVANWYRTPAGGAIPPASIKTTSPTTPTPAPGTTTTTTTTTTTSIITTTTTTTASAPISTAPLTCVVSAGRFCGTILHFNDAASCRNSESSCYQQSANCLQQAGRKNRNACSRYFSICNGLNAYCGTCASGCSDGKFLGTFSGVRNGEM